MSDIIITDEMMHQIRCLFDNANYAKLLDIIKPAKTLHMDISPKALFEASIKKYTKQEMKLSDLQPLDIVRIRSGNMYFVNIVFPNPCSKNGLAFFGHTGGKYHASDFNDNLKFHVGTNTEIVAVYKNSNPKLFRYTLVQKILNYHCENLDIEWTWERNDTKALTVKEIEKLLGYKIKIVNQHDDT